MATLSCPVAKIERIEEIEGADRIELAFVLGFQVIVEKGQFVPGQLGAFIPSDSVLPADLAASLKGKAKLFGEQKNRTRVFKIRGAVSEGVLLGPLPGAEEGAELAKILGVKKYAVPKPKVMGGLRVKTYGHTVRFDIQNYKRWPRVLLEGENVEISEKIHGTFCQVTLVPGLNRSWLINKDTIVSSKTLAREDCSLADLPENRDNIYIKTIKHLRLREKLIEAFGYQTPVSIFGEIYGPGVQDLTYGQDDLRFSFFDIYYGKSGEGRYLDRREIDMFDGVLGSRAPVLFRGPFEKPYLKELCSGETIIGNGAHIREGVVVRPLEDRWHPKIGRVILKYVSPEYLTRANGTEYT